MKVEIEASEEKEKKYGKFDEWEIKCAVDTLINAEEIKNDAAKMEYVKPLLKEKMEGMSKAITSLEQLKAVAKEKINKSQDD